MYLKSRKQDTAPGNEKVHKQFRSVCKAGQSLMNYLGGRNARLRG
jgi:hypothetical protein